MARDYFGKELRVGDKVTEKQVKINGTRHAGHKCIKISKRRKHYESTDEETN